MERLNNDLLWPDSTHKAIQESTAKADLADDDDEASMMTLVKNTASKSLQSVRRFIAEAEDAVRSSFSPLNDPHKEYRNARHLRRSISKSGDGDDQSGQHASSDDEEYQMQLATALSLSSMDCVDAAVSEQIASALNAPSQITVKNAAGNEKDTAVPGTDDGSVWERMPADEQAASTSMAYQ